VTKPERVLRLTLQSVSWYICLQAAYVTAYYASQC